MFAYLQLETEYRLFTYESSLICLTLICRQAASTRSSRHVRKIGLSGLWQLVDYASQTIVINAPIS